MSELVGKILTKVGLNKDGSNITIRITFDGVELNINGQKIFETLSNRNLIVGALKKELDNLVEAHLARMAENEKTGK